MDLSLILLTILLKLCCAQGSHPPRIVEHPIDTTVPRHEPATLNCKAEGSPSPTIQWYKDGVPLKILPGSHRITLPAGGLFFLKVIYSRRDTDAGLYWCEAKNELGVARSRNATLQVAVLREDFRLEPQNTRLALGETALLECAAPRGIPEPTVMWKKDGQKLDLEGSKRIRIVDGGNLAIQDARQSDEGQYQCIAQNPAGIRESTIAILKVHIKPFIIRGPHDQSVLEGSSVTFPCRVGGDPMPDVLWLRTASGGNMPLDRVSVMEDRSLRLERVTVADEGEYSCEADNIVGAISAMGTLTVYAPPKITQRPASKSIELGGDTSFECRASGSPQPTIFWTIKNNHTIIFPGALPLGRFQSINTEKGHSILTLTKFQRSDKDLIIICNAVNEVAAITARAQLSLDSQEDRAPPIIIAGPVNQTLPVKSVATLQCKAIGLPNPTISWYRDGIPVQASAKVNITTAGNLIISDLDRNDDQGLYTCVASSRTGKSTWSGFLRIEVPTNPNIKFYRAPDQSKCPSAPGQPTVLNMSPTSVTITWTTSEKAGASPILGYSVEMYSTNKTKTWIPIAARLSEHKYTVEGLTNDAMHMFIVRAENAHGFSPPSPISEPITIEKVITNNEAGSSSDIVLLSEIETLLQSNDIVELLEAEALNATVVRLNWDVDNAKYVEGLYVYAREVHSTEYKVITISTVSSNSASSCVINNLQKASTYEFFLVPFYKSVIGKPTNSKYARTKEDVPESPPYAMEARQFNRTSVFLKWLPPHPNKTRNGVLTYYSIIVRGLDSYNTTRILKNMTIDAASPTLLLANLTTGVTYYIAVAAATKIGIGPYSPAVVLRMDPKTQALDTTGYTRYPISRDIADDFLTKTWFIVLLGSVIAIIVFLLGALVLFKRYQFIKQTSLGSLHGNHAISTVRKFPALPINANGVWIDPNGSVWRQAVPTCTTKEQLPDYTQVTSQQTLPLPDYERLTPLNAPDYAEVACSTFKSPNGFLSLVMPNEKTLAAGRKSPSAEKSIDSSDGFYDSCGAYATTNLVTNVKRYQNQYASSAAVTAPTANARQANASATPDGQSTAVVATASPALSASPYAGFEAKPSDKMTASTASTAILTASPVKIGYSRLAQPTFGNSARMNITGNKMELINNSNYGSSTSSTSSSTATTTTSTSAGIDDGDHDDSFVVAKVPSPQPQSLTQRLNPFDVSHSNDLRQLQQQQQQLQQQQQHQPLLIASNSLKAGLGAYVNTTMMAQMQNGGGAGTLRRQRKPKIFKSENNINIGSYYSSKLHLVGNTNSSSGINASTPLKIAPPPASSRFNILLNNSNCDSDNDGMTAALSNSTNHLLADWSSSSIMADDQPFGGSNKMRNNSQHYYVKSTNGTWSTGAPDSDSYKIYERQQQQQQQLQQQSTNENDETHKTNSLNNANYSFSSSVYPAMNSETRHYASFNQKDNV